MAGPTPSDQPVPTSTTNTSRVIPGLSSQPPPSSSNKRSRKKKTAPKVDDPTKLVPTIVDEPSSESIEPTPVLPTITASAPEPPNGVIHSAPSVSASVSVSPVQQVQKRIRAATKKVQRISGYESSTVPLNEDQKRAIASKPALEATVKELQDLLKILEEDEKLDELRIQAVREEEELKVKGRVDSAVAAEQNKAESNLTFLLQFLHLYSLVSAVTRPTESFAPPMVSPVIQSATAQELAAVNSLFHRLADGPIGGGEGSAFDSLNQFNEGSDVDLIEGVTFGRIKEMVIQLTASPVELAPVPQILAPAEDLTKVEETVQMPSTSFGSMMFLQQSEVLPNTVSPNAQNDASVSTLDILPTTSFPEPVVEKESSVDHVARNKQLLEQANIASSDSVPPNANNWNAAEQPPTQTHQLTAPSNAEDWNTATEHLSASQAEVVARTIDWAEDVQGQGEGPPSNSNTNLPPIPAHPHPSGDPPIGQHMGPPRHHINNGRGNYRGRGGYRGGPGMPRGVGNPDGYRGGRGWYRGNPGFRGGRGGPPPAPPPMDMNNPGGWRPGPVGPPEVNGGYRPRGDYPGGRYGGHRGASRGANVFHRPPHPSSQLYHPEVAAGASGGGVY